MMLTDEVSIDLNTLSDSYYLPLIWIYLQLKYI
jgi:hypothetical protein